MTAPSGGSARPDPYVDLSDEAAHRAAVQARREERERSARAGEVASWSGTLRDLAERRVDVSVSCAAGRQHRGALVAVGVDHIGLRVGPSGLVVIAIDTVRAVRPEPGSPGGAAMGDRDEPRDRRIEDVLDEVVARDGRVAVVLRDVPEPLHGEVLGLGDDVLTIRLETARRERVFVPLAAIAELLVTG